MTDPQQDQHTASHRFESGEAASDDVFCFPLSFAQERLWFLHQLDPHGDAYHLPVALRLQGVFDRDAFGQSVQDMIRRHETLRTSFTLEADQPVQVVSATGNIWPVVVDLNHISQETREPEAMRLARAEAKQPFDLQNGPLLRVTLLTLTPDECVLLLTMHHIITDLWSMNILVQEITGLYTAYTNNQPADLPDLPIQYSDFAVWQRQKLQGDVLQGHVCYWRDQFTPLPAELGLPTDYPRPALQRFHGENFFFKVPWELTQALRQLGEREGSTLFMTLLAAFTVQLYRYTGQNDIVVGSPIANRNRREIEGLIGFFVNTLALRTRLSGSQTFLDVLAHVSETALDAYEHQDMPFEVLIEKLQPERDWSRPPLFQVMFALQNAPLGHLELPALTLTSLELDSGATLFDLSLFLEERAGELVGRLEYNTDLFTRSTLVRFADHFLRLLHSIVANPTCQVWALPLLSEEERRQLLTGWNATAVDYRRDQLVSHLLEEQAAKTPDAIALVSAEMQYSYATLERQANRLGNYLQRLGIGPESTVGVCLERSADLIVGLSGILKAGGAYLPLDPQYPGARLRFMITDAGVSVVLTQSAFLELFEGSADRLVPLDRDWPAIALCVDTVPRQRACAENLAYVIYTSGSTGVPKGVMVQHRNVCNFVAGMDHCLQMDPPGTWLAVTGVAFDISVLEIFWTLARGFRVILQADLAPSQPFLLPGKQGEHRGPDFSLFYFASDDQEGVDEHDRYRLLLDGALFADRHGFSAVWTPERHFHSFGGLYPNPAVTGAALAVLTKRVHIRAGSVVLPLQNPLRVAEEWAVVDNLSQGRAGISFASGWHANDFALAPEKYVDRRAIMERDIESVRRLWRGEALALKDGTGHGVAIRTRPSPFQRELPLWLTAAGSPQTFELAGKMGLRILTHLLGQSLEELAEKIALYRRAWREHGHPAEGYVTLMLHTFVAENSETVRQIVSAPFRNYLRSSVDLLDRLAQSSGSAFGVKDFSDDDKEALLAHAFERYFQTSGLFGTPHSCLPMVAHIKAIGVDEIACLIDFGVETQTVLSHLPYLNELRLLSARQSEPTSQTLTPATQLKRYAVSHVQCTPSFVRILLADPATAHVLPQLRQLLLGGEVFPTSLAAELQPLIAGDLLNMYGPTETTIWSTTHLVQPEQRGTGVSIGRPIANSQVYLLDHDLQLLPCGVPGEVYISGEGLARGYLQRPEVTAQRFLPDPFSAQPGARMYKTGDRARYLPAGELEYLGRNDFQVKVRGFRIEPGEIEATLALHPGVQQAIVLVRSGHTDQSGAHDQHLVAYILPTHSDAVHTAELSHFVRQRLPMYMVPETLIVLEHVPLTSNGKVDRQALLALGDDLGAREPAFLAPRSSAEVVIAGVWAEVLGLTSVGVQHNFFALGGHSLLATTVIARLRAIFQVDIPLRRLLEEPTISALAREIQRLWQGDGETVEDIAQIYLQFQQLSDAEVQAQLSS